MQAVKCLFRTSNTVLPSVQIRNRSFPSWWHAVRTSMKKRKAKLERLGPPPPRPRSIWINWNYRAELFAFAKRLNEDLQESTLQRAFTHRSYVESEQSKRETLGHSQNQELLNIEDNFALVTQGENVMSNFVQKYLHLAYPLLPEEGRRKLQEYLLNQDRLAHVASNLGFKDLILSADFPASDATLASTFQAVVGAVMSDGGFDRAELFVQDFIIPELIGKDVLEIWDIPNPVAYLKNMLLQVDKQPEFRLLKEAGRNTLFAVYLVGIYVDKEFMGQGPGETLSIAQEMASLNVLKKLFGLQDFASPLPFGAQAEKMLKKTATVQTT